MKSKVLTVIKLIVFIVYVSLIVIGQREAGRVDFGIMLVGLAGLLGLLYNYNRKYV
jgi:hypothetical protein